MEVSAHEAYRVYASLKLSGGRVQFLLGGGGTLNKFGGGGILRVMCPGWRWHIWEDFCFKLLDVSKVSPTGNLPLNQLRSNSVVQSCGTVNEPYMRLTWLGNSRRLTGSQHKAATTTWFGLCSVPSFFVFEGSPLQQLPRSKPLWTFRVRTRRGACFIEGMKFGSQEEAASLRVASF